MYLRKGKQYKGGYFVFLHNKPALELFIPTPVIG